MAYEAALLTAKMAVAEAWIAGRRPDLAA